MAFRFKLFLNTGEEAGEYVTAIPGPSAPGDEVITGQHKRFRITAIVATDDVDWRTVAGAWEVEPVN